MNKDFLYGEITVRFITGIPIRAKDQTILDIGCGTGFVFDELHEVFEVGSIQGIGVEPAQGMLELATRKHQDNANFQFHLGSFEDLPVADKSVDHIVFTLALDWVKSLAVAADEMVDRQVDAGHCGSRGQGAVHGRPEERIGKN